jgi:hypothetical protein
MERFSTMGSANVRFVRVVQMFVTCRYIMARPDGANGEHGPYKRLLI